MSHKTEVKNVNIVDKVAFALAMKALGVEDVVQGGTIYIYDGNHIKAEVSATVYDRARGKKYSIGLVKDPTTGKFKLVGDFMCFGWVLPEKMRSLLKGKGVTDGAIADMVKQYTTAHTLARMGRQKGYGARIVEQSDGKLRVKLERA